jgi:hypothetical protein
VAPLPDSYAFVMNVSSLTQGAASFELAEGFRIRRATAREIIEIKKTLYMLPSGDITSGLPVPNIWERPWPHGNSVPPAALPEAEWRYFVIASPSPCQPALYELCPILNLAPTELQVGFTRSFYPSPSFAPGCRQSYVRCVETVS